MADLDLTAQIASVFGIPAELLTSWEASSYMIARRQANAEMERFRQNLMRRADKMMAYLFWRDMVLLKHWHDRRAQLAIPALTAGDRRAE